MTALRYLRKSTRFALASFLWLHALFVLRLAPINIAPVAARMRMSETELVLAATIVGAGLLKMYGWKKITVDLLYIYTFPFVLPCLLIYWAVIAIRALKHAFRGTQEEPQAPLEVVLPTTTSTPIRWTDVVRAVGTGIFGFVTLWGLMVVYTTHRWMLAVATVMVAIAISRMLYVVLKFFVFSTDWLSNLESRIQTIAENWIACITAWTDSEPSTEVKNAWNGLRAFKLGVELLRNRRRVIQWTIGLGAVVFGIVYAYAAVLFSFAYVGLARLSGAGVSWSDSLLTAFLLPISYGDLPRVVVVRLFGAAHYLFLVVFGVGSFWTYLRRKARSIETTLTIVKLKMEQEAVVARFDALEKKLGAQAQMLPGTTAKTSAS